MKKILFLTLLLLFAPSAQAALPVQLIVQWDPSPVSDNVTSYDFQFDANSIISIPTTVDVTCNCIQTTILVATTGTHTVQARAVNMFAVGVWSTLSFNANPPGKINQIRIK